MSSFTDFENSIAVVTGGASGIGREITFQLVNIGTHVAVCDVDEVKLENVVTEAKKINPNVKITRHKCDVAKEDEVEIMVKEVAKQHNTNSINLLFNNAGIVGGRSFIKSSQKEWEKTFNVSWVGTYLCTRYFLKMLLMSKQGVVVNTSSVNALWASLGQKESHSAYSTAKFAVRGFTESLIVDFQANAPHLSAMLVLPGHIKTGMPSPPKSWRNSFNGIIKDYIPVSAEDAAIVIINAIKKGDWRVLIGQDAYAIDKIVRENPFSIYD
ncbi:SDR family NAD(P)-dependent oxidoreductase [Spirochaeta cellobiosiphila]|uniref:SDR family NAD(P)-dependent oxidoreductase n=1 Tax=Spirochaeta cellobiosiphila TaxID=504483 RepID=UPI0004188044|nr:SDR family NAD(P)-dependent oxidoreductase [Spirochaeta cellobiosiphila]